MPGVESRDFDTPDETRTPDKTQVAVVRMGVTTLVLGNCGGDRSGCN